jgi:esterase
LTTVELAYRRQGSGPPLLCLHGLLGSGRNWVGIATALADRFDVILPDLRNHGTSPWSDEVTYPAMAADVTALLDRLGLDRVHLLGHSMGGKVAMTLALTVPERVDRLIVADIAPVQYGPGLETYIDAMLAVDLGQVTRRDQADAALTAAAPEPGIRSFLLQNLERREGQFTWRPNLAVLRAAMPLIRGFPDLPGARPYQDPCCFIHGARSTYVQDEHLPRVRELFPGAKLHTIKDAGHWLHAEQPQAFLDALLLCLGR